MPARSFDELQASAIEHFLLSPYNSMTNTRKMHLRAVLIQWHPDVSTTPAASLSHFFPSSTLSVHSHYSYTEDNTPRIRI
jgi:hypothetical protein